MVSGVRSSVFQTFTGGSVEKLIGRFLSSKEMKDQIHGKKKDTKKNSKGKALKTGYFYETVS